jgi:phage baseplate assembly protein W
MARVFSQEDANISKISASSTRTRPYKDIDLTFTASDIGNIFKKTETAAVKQAVKTLLNSNKFDKPFEPSFGIDLQSYFFELADEQTGGRIVEKIKSTIETYEPRASVRNIRVGVQEDINAVNILLSFSVRNTDQTITVETTISRLR